MKPLSGLFLTLMFVFSSLLSWYSMIYKADILPPFPNDEIVNLQSATSLFSNGQYKSAFGYLYSSGIAVTWPSAIGWYLGRNIFGARLSCSSFSWFFSILLGFIFLRRSRYTRTESLATAVGLWAVTITTPLSIPYWFGFMYNLGELNTVILIGFGILLLSRHQLWGVFIFGIAFWHGKFTYLPLIFFLLLGNFLSQGLSLRRKVVVFLIYSVIFFLPLFIWIGWLYLRFDISIVKQCLSEQLKWFDDMFTKSHHLRLSRVVFSFDTLKQRLTLPIYEWQGYSLGTKIKDLFFTLGAITVTIMALFIAKKKRLSVSNRERWVTIMVSVSIGFYCVFYFLIHSYMWQRYLQPAVYSGFGLFVFWLAKWIKSYSLNLRPLFYIAAIFLILTQLNNTIKHPLIQPQLSYARLCKDLYSPIFLSPIDTEHTGYKSP